MVKVATTVDYKINADNSPLEGAMRLKQAPLDIFFCLFYCGILGSEPFLDSQKSWFWPESENFDPGKKKIPTESGPQKKQNSTNFSSVAPCSEELWMQILFLPPIQI